MVSNASPGRRPGKQAAAAQPANKPAAAARAVGKATVPVAPQTATPSVPAEPQTAVPPSRPRRAVAKPAPAAKSTTPLVKTDAPVVERQASTPVAAAQPATAIVSQPTVEAPAASHISKPASKPLPLMTQVKSMTSNFPSAPFAGYDDLTAFSKANVDALIQANQVLAKGFEEISKEVVSLTQSSLESAASTAKAIFAAKSLKDVIELNSDYTKKTFDKMVANSTKLSELGVKVATDAFAPVTARVNSAVEKITKPAA